MRSTIFFIFLFFIGEIAFSQGGKDTVPGSPWKDTNMVKVKLKGAFIEKKIVMMNIGAKAVIYVQASDLRQLAMKNIADSNAADRYRRVIRTLDKNKADTLRLSEEDIDMEYVISDVLQKGMAMVYYKKMKKYVPVIMHRVEKYGMYADRVFYLPDRRPFYMVMEYSGIIEDGKLFSDPSELGKEYDKLSGLRKE